KEEHDCQRNQSHQEQGSGYLEKERYRTFGPLVREPRDVMVKDITHARSDKRQRHLQYANGDRILPRRGETECGGDQRNRKRGREHIQDRRGGRNQWKLAVVPGNLKQIWTRKRLYVCPDGGQCLAKHP